MVLYQAKNAEEKAKNAAIAAQAEEEKQRIRAQQNEAEAERQKWNRGDRVELGDGLSAAEAIALGLADDQARGKAWCSFGMSQGLADARTPATHLMTSGIGRKQFCAQASRRVQRIQP